MGGEVKCLLKKILCFILNILFISLLSVAQEKDSTKIEILNANTLEVDKTANEEVRKLIGDVVLLHNGIKMYCDSALIYAEKNLIDAYSNVYFNRGDTLKLYGDFLKYNGNTSVGNIRNNIKLIDNHSVLVTEFLDFNTKDNIAYFFNGGEITSADNNIVSKSGTYYSNIKLAHFKDSVVLINPNYTMYTDTFKYHTENKIAYFVGPTTIISDSTEVYCEYGWYNTFTDISKYSINACIKDGEKILKADTLFYDKQKGIGEAWNNIDFYDSIQNIILRGNYSYYRKEPEYFMITDKALFIQVMEGNDSIFFHADTLMSEYNIVDSCKVLKAFYKVKFFKNDFQGKCDSLSYNTKDSIIQMHRKPILWSGENQITSSFVEAYVIDDKIDHANFKGPIFIISQEDSIRFNQITGKKMVAYFKNNQLNRMLVNGNARSIFFPEDNGDLIGVNKSESSELILLFKDGNIERVRYLKEPDATLFPLEDIVGNDLKFKGFGWFDAHRPKNKNEIFLWVE